MDAVIPNVRLPPLVATFLLSFALVCKLAKDDNMVFDLCMETSATEKACYLREKQWNFIGCDNGSMRNEKMMPSFLDTFLKQILSEVSENLERKGIHVAAKVHLKMLSPGRSTCRRITRNPLQAFLQCSPFRLARWSSYYNAAFRQNSLRRHGRFLVCYGQRSAFLGSTFLFQTLFFLKNAWPTEWL